MNRIGADRVPFTQSPNCVRSGMNTRQFIILHGSGGPEAGSESWVLNPAAQVSYHYFIGKNDHALEDVRQFVSEDDIAWHVGQSRWREVTPLTPDVPRVWAGMNACSVGVALESMNRPDEVYPEWQLAVCRELVRDIMHRNSIPAHRVLTHRMVSDPPGRKVDPVAFPYEDFIRSLAAPTEPVGLAPRLRELEGLRLFIDDEHQGRVEAARVVADKLYIRRVREESE